MKDNNTERLLLSLSGLSGRVLIMGGSFDPVHNGHLEMAEAIRNRYKIGRIIFLPTHQNPLKQIAPMATDRDRIQMLLLATSEREEMYVSPYEAERSGPCYTVDTLTHITTTSTAQIYFAIGTDQLPNLHRWRELDKIFKLAHLVLVSRQGFKLKQLANFTKELSPLHIKHLSENFIDFDNPASATEIRKAIKHLKISTLPGKVPEQVLKYIEAYRLYL